VSAFTHAVVFCVSPGVLYLSELVASVVNGEEEPMVALGILEVLAGTCVRTSCKKVTLSLVSWDILQRFIFVN